MKAEKEAIEKRQKELEKQQELFEKQKNEPAKPAQLAKVPG